jgi:F0F1-type ATP synthase alpha subunit
MVSKGKRPAVNPFLSVTRVGHQTQTPLQKDVSRELSEFLVTYERMKQFMHFGAEIGGATKNILDLGAMVDAFFYQSGSRTVAINTNILILAGLWSGVWNEVKLDEFKREMEQLILLYETDSNYQKEVDKLIESLNTFSELVMILRRDNKIITSGLNRSSR